jgi:hypothetical protein
MTFGLLLALALPAVPAFGDPPAAAGRTLRFETEPDGVRVFERRRGNLHFLGRTPCEVSLPADAGDHTKLFFLRKLGFEAGSVTVKPSQTLVRAPMRKVDIFEPLREEDVALRRMQEAVFGALRTAIYARTPSVDDTGFDLVGKIGLFELDGRVHVGAEILLDDAFRSRLRPIRRIRNRAKHQEAVARAVLEHAGVRFLALLRGALEGVEGPQGVTLGVHYRKSRSVLGEDVLRFQKTGRVEAGRYVRSWWALYEVPRLAVKDVEDVYTVVVQTTLADIPTTPDGDCGPLLRRGSIHLDDNPRREMERLDPASGD